MIYKHHPTITTDDLPNECLYEIFKYLNLQDVINCRTVSKRFKSISDLIKFRQLIVSDIIGELKSMWFADKSRPINYMNAINFQIFQTFRSSFNLKHTLERLHIRKYADKNFELPNLAGFNNLQELEIDSRINNVHLTLELPKLKMFRLARMHNGFHLHLKTPTKLEILDFICLTQLEIDHPESIKQLKTFWIDEEELPKLAAMKNLECLHTGEAAFGTDLLRGILSFFKNLKHLQFDLLGDKEEISNFFKHVLVQKDALQRPNFKLYLGGVELIDSRKVDEYFLRESVQHFQMQNIDLLNGDLSNIKVIFFDYLFKSTVDNRISTNYVSKLYNIRQVEADNKVNVEYLIWLLKKSDYLEVLSLFGTELNQTFFDHTLPDICPNLIRLKIGSSLNLVKQINFAEKFGFLLYFSFDDEIGDFTIWRDHPDHKFDTRFYLNPNLRGRTKECRRNGLDLNELFIHYYELRAKYNGTFVT